MKRYCLKLLMVFAIITSISVTAEAQFVIKVRPVAPVIVRPAAPSARHLWVDGEWVWRGGRYEYVNGYWAAPPRPGVVWIPGHWKDTRRGWMWKPGHWRR